VKKFDNAQEAINILRAAGIRVPIIVDVKVTELERVSDGVIQVWKCKKCRYWEYNSPIAALDVECPKGHFAYLDWDIKDSTQGKP
jgi:hypothetical protein